MSKVILAHLPSHRLKTLFNRNEAVIAAADLGSSWKEFRDRLAKIRKEGYAISRGEFNLGVVGVAAPIFNRDKVILGSVGVAFLEEEMGHVDPERVFLVVKRAGREITQAMVKAVPGLDLPARAVG